jgi:hypothetical protein
MYAYKTLPTIPLYINAAANRPKTVRPAAGMEMLQPYDEQVLIQLMPYVEQIAVSDMSGGAINFKCPEHVHALLRVKRAISLLRAGEIQKATSCLRRMVGALKNTHLFVSFVDLEVEGDSLRALLLSVEQSGHCPNAAYVDAYRLYAYSFQV